MGNIFKSFTKWTDAKFGHHLTAQEEKIRQILESLLDMPDTLKYPLPTSVFYVANDRVKSYIRLTDTSIHVVVDGTLLVLTCDTMSSVKLKRMVTDRIIQDSTEVEQKLKDCSVDVTQKALEHITKNTNKTE
jgi:hypothetical protein